MKFAFYFYGMRKIEGIHPLDGGLVRRKYRKDRRPGLPVESPLVFYPQYFWETITKSIRLFALFRQYKRILARVENTPEQHTYMDAALAQPTQ